MSKQETALLQHWMKQVITSPGTLQQKLLQAQHHYTLSEHDVLAAHGKASVYTRLNVYTSGYILRLLECLSADFPVLKQFLGDELFNTFAKASLVWSPPVSYTLYDLGKNFIAFLEATRPDGDDVMLDLPAALARLERARQETMRAAGTEDNNASGKINPEDILWRPHSLMLSLPESTRLLQSSFALKDFFERLSAEEPAGLPEAQPVFIAVSRKNYRISINEIPGWQYYFLLSCRQPVDLLHAIDNTAKTAGLSASSLMADLYIWLPVLCDSGMLTCTQDAFSV